ncbi:reductive dehalogenase [Dehalogenimonas etheniformans]|uniref:Reductive dehalogenase n=1 Tax=Dehalogenimonas etheniformans TaxID=1536648 RepID=A0A2P5P9Z7_9CHLR|nr:reductive dehalogenase [Dehalogenimonas etheniformans]PPD59097.1 reductive dehalogenase [Dehalogenimonas etheniformans]QNT76778.1 reductive dehalogenase [Dehalogenimonas etheniformans]
MSKFHSMVSRRDFMKGLGLAGMGAAALTTPIFHDLDEVVSSSLASFERPWWVKQREEPTVEIDWNVLKRYDARIAKGKYTDVQHWGMDRMLKAAQEKSAFSAAQAAGAKGFTTRDRAFSSAASLVPRNPEGETWMGYTKVKTPEQQGLPKWQGTPEENTRMLRAVAKAYGASALGADSLGSASDKRRNLIHSYDRCGPKGSSISLPLSSGTSWPPAAGYWRKIDFEDVDVGYSAPLNGEADCRLVLPNKELWSAPIMIQMPRDGWRTCAPDKMRGSTISGWSNGMRYQIWHHSVSPGVKGFLRGIGYNGYGSGYPESSSGGLMQSEAAAVTGGLAEMGRPSEVCIYPEWGPASGWFDVITDLPLAPLKPVDAGIFRFCHTCKKCAEVCPSQSVSYDKEPSWEIPQFDYLVPNMRQQAGKRLFWIDTQQCNQNQWGCTNICRGQCTMNVDAAAMVHAVVRGTVSVTPIFNSFLWNMGKTFNYGFVDPEDWWAIASDLPTHHTVGTLGATRGL